VRVLVEMLGTGDAAGCPKIGCECAACRDALRGGRSRRTRFSVLLRTRGGVVLIDTSPDLREQLLRARIPKVDAVLWTHPHYDHYGGLPELFRVQRRVRCYGTHEMKELVENTFSFMPLRFTTFEPFEEIELFGLRIIPVPVHHPPLKEPCGFVVIDDDQKLVITGDTSIHIPEGSLELMREPRLLIADAIHPTLNFNKHMNATEALGLGRMLRAERVLLTHLSHLYPPHEQAIKRYPLAHDGMCVALDATTLDTKKKKSVQSQLDGYP